MREELGPNDILEIKIQAREYESTISGTAESLELIGFPAEWITANPEEIEGFSAVIGDFRSACHDEYVGRFGSYDEFSEIYEIKIKVKFENGEIVET